MVPSSSVVAVQQDSTYVRTSILLQIYFDQLNTLFDIEHFQARVAWVLTLTNHVEQLGKEN